MSDNITSDKLKLVEDGIKTVQFIQENREKLQKTYGRSAIQQPSTKDRTAAWETFISKDNPGENVHAGEHYSSEDYQSASCSGSSLPDGSNYSCRRVSDNSGNFQTERTNNKDRDDKDSLGSDGRNWKGDQRNCGGAIAGGDPGCCGIHESEGSNPYVTSDLEDYERITNFDIATSGNEDDYREAGITMIKDATPTDIEAALNEDNGKTHKRLRGISNFEVKDQYQEETDKPVKKGIDGNTASMSLKGKRTSGNGATQSVLQSPLNQNSPHAYVENAQGPARDAERMNSNLDRDKSNSEQDEIQSKLDKILENQNMILKKLDIVYEVREEINSIQKVLRNQGLSLSVIDSCLNDLMIAIPSQGKDQSSKNVDTNPDLKLVIGRDNRRGLSDLTDRKQSIKDVKFGEDIYKCYPIDKRYMQEPLNFNTNNAANFVPQDDNISLSVVMAMIDRKVKDKSKVERLKKLIMEGYGKIPLKEIYSQIIKLMN
ncbi:phosphoprotein [Feline paramyxovirus 163]|uniref:phosphoprotein n=1 Tax=Feline paramyxovirus 163 TaxID=2486281 RepID=UPI0012A312A8|nr:phosphoprotein [Feline paramyxovirus 163]BBG92169.1 phosphoprotein [Feline paramyxovirus 163]